MIRSLRFRLLAHTSASAAIVLGLLGFGLYFWIRESQESEFNDALLTEARAVASTAEERGKQIIFDYAPEELPKFSAGHRPDYFQAWIDPGGIVRSPSLADKVLPRPDGGGGIKYIDLILPDGRPGRALQMSFTTTIEPYAGGDSSTSASPHAVLLTVATDTIALRASLANFAWMLAGMCGLAVVVSGAVLVWIVGRGVRPLERLAVAIGRMQEKDLSMRLHAPDAPSELEPVVEKLNGLLSRLDAAFSREKAFTADVAHELRTPLAALLTTFDVCRSRPRDQAGYVAAIDKCRDVARQMQSMVETLLILTRADAGLLSLDRKKVDFADLLDDCWAMFSPRAQGRALNLQWRVASPILIETDPEKLRIILHNIFDNSVSYTPGGGTVRVDAEMKGDRLRVEIANTAPQIPADQASHLFDRFWRGDQARAETGVHCGLGLSLCQRLSRLLEGQIDVESTAENWFIVRLSLPALAGPEQSMSAQSMSAQSISAQTTSAPTSASSKSPRAGAESPLGSGAGSCGA